jgi:hypothetical protein
MAPNNQFIFFHFDEREKRTYPTLTTRDETGTIFAGIVTHLMQLIGKTIDYWACTPTDTSTRGARFDFSYNHPDYQGPWVPDGLPPGKRLVVTLTLEDEADNDAAPPYRHVAYYSGQQNAPLAPGGPDWRE